MRFRFPKAMRLLRRRQFRRVIRGGGRRVGRWVVVDSRQGWGPRPKLGITVSTKFGKAYRRNRFKRIVREAFRRCQHQLPQQLEINIRPRSAAAEATAMQVEVELLEMFAGGGEG